MVHIILPDLGRSGGWYDVKVFPASPLLDPQFEECFPDDLALPTDSWSYLSERGLGPSQETFNCKHEDNMRRRFQKTVGPLLITKAIPYLDRIRTIEDMLPLIRHPLPLGCALHHVGRIEEARPILREQRDRLSRLDQQDSRIAAWLRKLDELLSA